MEPWLTNSAFTGETEALPRKAFVMKRVVNGRLEPFYNCADIEEGTSIAVNQEQYQD
jgi:hypothetical protein